MGDSARPETTLKRNDKMNSYNSSVNSLVANNSLTYLMVKSKNDAISCNVPGINRS